MSYDFFEDSDYEKCENVSTPEEIEEFVLEFSRELEEFNKEKRSRIVV
jgi:hypothetical protein